MNALILLERRKDVCKVSHGWTSLGAKHPHQAFDGNPRVLFQVLETHGRIHIVAQNQFSGFEVTVQDAFNGLA
jgi:hypothetical protein